MRHLVLLAVLGLLAACGGGSGSGTSGSSTSSSAPAAPVANAAIGGIWSGTDVATGLSLLGLIDEAGEFHFLRSDNAQYIGTISSAGNAITGSVEGYTQMGTIYPDGSTHGTGTLSGTVAARTSLSGTVVFRTDAGANTTNAVTLNFQSSYNRASSLATISGNYLDPSSGDVVSVTASGVATWFDAATRCSGFGTVSIISATYNVYRIQWAYMGCTGGSAVLNGVSFAGLGTLDNSTSPERFILGAHGQTATAKYALVLTLRRT